MDQYQEDYIAGAYCLKFSKLIIDDRQNANIAFENDEAKEIRLAIEAKAAEEKRLAEEMRRAEAAKVSLNLV